MYVTQKTKDGCWMDGWIERWMDGCLVVACGAVQRWTHRGTPSGARRRKLIIDTRVAHASTQHRRGYRMCEGLGLEHTSTASAYIHLHHCHLLPTSDFSRTFVSASSLVHPCRSIHPCRPTTARDHSSSPRSTSVDANLRADVLRWKRMSSSRYERPRISGSWK
jgi:hypothetical protein